MKKRIIIFYTGIITLSLTAYSVINRDNTNTHILEAPKNNEIAFNGPFLDRTNENIFTDFIYDVGPRFSSIKKTDIDKARGIDDFLDKDQVKSIVTIKSIRVIIMNIAV